MLVLGKSGNDILILCEDNNVQKGDYLRIIDDSKRVSLIVQVYDIDYFNLPGLEEDLLRELLVG